MKFKIVSLRGIAVIIAFASVASGAAAQKVYTFDNGMADWEIVDDVDLGEGPSSWEVRASEGLDGQSLFQDSNVWGTAADSCLIGTFALLRNETVTDFLLEMDVVAEDNDGIGLVWAYTDTAQHYRMMMINDVWPEIPVDGVRGPFARIDKRVSDSSPWYETVTLEKDNYVPFVEDVKLHWTLEVRNGEFTFTREDGFTITGQDNAYKAGRIGIQLYAMQAEFDNVELTDLTTTAVDPKGKAATMWAALKDN